MQKNGKKAHQHDITDEAIAKPKVNSSSSVSSSVTASTSNNGIKPPTHTLPPFPDQPLTAQQKAVVDFIATTEPLRLIEEEKERFVRRLTAVYEPAWVLQELRGIVAYCADHERWERTTRDWGRTIRNWLRRSQEQRGNVGKLNDLVRGALKKRNEQL